MRYQGVFLKWIFACVITCGIACFINSCARSVKNESPPPVFSSKDDIKRLAYLGIYQLRAEHYEKARSYFAYGLRQDPRNCELNFFNGLSYHLEGQDGSVRLLNLAAVGYQNAIKFCPGDPWPHYYYGVLALETGDYPLAEQLFSAASQLSPNRATTTLFLEQYLNVAFRMGDVGTVKKIIAQLKQLDPQSPLIKKLNNVFYSIRTPKTNLKTRNAVKPPSPKTITPNSKQLTVDGVIILSRETAERKRGVNLLKGLTLQYGQGTATPGLSYTSTASSVANWPGTISASGESSFTLPTLPFSSQAINTISTPAVTYDLNIFNNADEKNEIIARPTLTVEHDKPATYFSGQDLILGITGTQAGSISKFPLGVTMTLTPHIETKDTVDLTIGMGREFLIPSDTNTTFTQVAQALKEETNTTVNLHYGETIVLSGLYDTRVEKTTNHVPILGQIPIIKYFFSRNTKKIVQTNLLMLLTPRKYVNFAAKYSPPPTQQLLSFYESLISKESRVESVLNNLRDIEVFYLSKPLSPALQSNSVMKEAIDQEFQAMYGIANVPRLIPEPGLESRAAIPAP